MFNCEACWDNPCTCTKGPSGPFSHWLEEAGNPAPSLSHHRETVHDLRDRAESAEAVLRVALSMMGDDDWSKDDVKGYLESSMSIINTHNQERE